MSRWTASLVRPSRSARDAVDALRDVELCERIVGRVFVIDGPDEERPQLVQQNIDGVLPPGFGQPGCRDGLISPPEIGVEVADHLLPVLVGLDLVHRVLILQVLGELPDRVNGKVLE